MTSADRWLLPDGVEEILPAQAHKLETLRRQLLDLYSSWGYQLVITPLIEFLDSLLVGSSHNLDLLTFKVTDQLSGRMMGIRADITPQAARIDAHCLSKNGPVRLCYADNVLHTKPRGLLSSRVPIRVGAELYGHAGIECDVELICLMHETLAAVEIHDIHLVLGHVGIFRTLIQESELCYESEKALFEAVQKKAYAEVDAILADEMVNPELSQMLQRLSRLSGDETVLAEAIEVFENAPQSVKKELADLQAVVEGIKQRLPEAVLCFDLCELSGYEYHTGIVFAAFTPLHGSAVAKGGRYDHIGEVFGRARPASGFDCDLKTLAKLSAKQCHVKPGILAPSLQDDSLMSLVTSLRSEGEIVIENLSDKPASDELISEINCDRQIIQQENGWVIVAI
ncbi:MAG: ATP phosphoribosyltransferase regulatory subunit [SAR86 cluster bacterium]|uniref:ATP phosphoribosyltransferase regulatory subunit n=1 Tax=SAR86 cluster bacterium TaxID=2030880 RepID=A0A2A4MI52_9GAMM|nr:MAG: ATP phosphoribosyltransferase regulatory subunit [SAR86 cluster bacterium]